MIHVLADVAIADLQTFIGAFGTVGAQLRRAHGSRRAQVYRHRDDERRVIVLFAWESREAFAGFLADPAIREAMKASGTLGRPEFTLLDKVADFPG